jgi:hypothetical protein
LTAEATLQASPAATLHAEGLYGEWRLSGLEIAIGQRLGMLPETPLARPAGDPVTALEVPIRRALMRPPCLVPFSGGRDSSAILAVATRLARREVLDPPIPATYRFPGQPRSHESDWQERVIDHLGLGEWEILEGSVDLDVIGPAATAAVIRHGPLTPPNAHFIVPLAERARGGSLLTGIDGDSLFGGWRWTRLAALARGGRRPEARDALRIARFLSPAALQRRVGARPIPPFPWLSDEAHDAVREIWGRDQFVQPRTFPGFIRWLRRSRHVDGFRTLLVELGADAGALVENPFLDEQFLASYAQLGGSRGVGDRTRAMQILFGGLLPPAVVTRPSKAAFDEVYMGERARAFAARWDGEGLDPALVPADRLRADWSSGAVSFRTMALMQWLWLRQRRDGGHS